MSDWPCVVCGRKSYSQFDWLYCSKLCQLSDGKALEKYVKIVTELNDKGKKCSNQPKPNDKDR